MPDIDRFKQRIDLLTTSMSLPLQTAQSHNALLTGSTEDLVSENDYRRKIAELMQTIESLEGYAGSQRKEIDIVHDRCDELELKLKLSESRVERLEEAIQMMGKEILGALG